MEIKRFEDQLIAFDFDKEMVNATDMARLYNKKPADFLRLDTTQNFIKELKSDVSQTHIKDNQIVTTIKGRFSDGRMQGTWMNEILALKFAAWLNPKFEVFIYRTFRNVLNEKFKYQQYQLDRLWDKEDQKDLYYQKQ